MTAPTFARRVLVTGGTGFVGRHAVDALIGLGWEVHVAARARPPTTTLSQFHQVDLLEPTSATRLIAAVAPEAILHLAWCVEPGAFWTDSRNLDWLSATLRLARAAADRGVGRFVGVGTCFEYAWPSDSPCVEEETPLAFHTLYDAAKAGAASVLERFFSGGSTQFAWARLFYLYGASENPSRFVAGLARALARGDVAKCSRGLVTRDFLDVRDVGAALAAVASADYRGPVNIGSGTGVRICDIARTLADLAGRPDLLQIGALPDRPDEPNTIVADTRILRQRIGFAPRFALETGLRAALVDAREREGVNGQC